MLNADDEPIECNLCKATIKNLNDGCFSCKDICNFYCCLNCFNYQATQIEREAFLLLMKHEWMTHIIAQ